MHKETFIFIQFEQTVVQVSKTENIPCLGTEVTFCPLATLVYYFNYINKEHSVLHGGNRSHRL